MTGMTTRIWMPKRDPGFRLGERVVAAKTSRGIEVAIALGAQRIATAVLSGPRVTAEEVPGTIAKFGSRSIWREGVIVPLEGEPVALPETLSPHDEPDRHRFTVDPGGVLITAPSAWSALHRVTPRGISWTIGSGTQDSESRVTDFASDRDRVFVGFTDGNSSVLAAYNQSAVEQWRTTLGGAAGQLAISEDSKQIAVITRAPTRCESCLDLEILSTGDGRALTSIALPPPGEGIPITLDGDPQRGRASIGFTHGQVWFHHWSPTYVDDMGSGRVPEKCGYAVYDVENRRLARSKTQECRIRAMVGLEDGTVITVEVSGESDVTVTTTSGPP